MIPKATDEEVIARVRECYENGETLGGGGVTPETVAEDFVLSAARLDDRLREIADDGGLERDYGFSDKMRKRVGYRPAEDEPEETRRLIADGGTDNSHAGVVARQLAEADEETLKEIGADEEGDQ